MFSNLSIRWKILGPVFVMGLISLALTTAALLNTRTMGTLTHELGARYLPATSLLLEADRDLHQTLLAERALIYAAQRGEPVRRWRQQIEENRQQSKERVEKFAEIAGELPAVAPRVESLVERYRGERATWERANDTVIDRVAAGDIGSADQLSLEQAAQSFETMRGTIDELSEVMTDAAVAVDLTSKETARANYLTNLVLGAAAVLVVIAVPLILVRSVLHPLGRLNAQLREVSNGAGDLAVRLPETSSDEIGQMSASFNRLLQNLGDMFRELKGDAHMLADGVRELEQGIRGVSERSTQLAEISTANAASIEELTVSISHIADNSTDADSLARETGDLTRHTADEVAQIAQQAAGSAERVRELATVLANLDQRSQSIHGIVGAIREIADQTNLLALNAAIEAARAGEQGRGFAVVADEVRKLAERTGSSTVEISSLLDGMRHETQQAVNFMEQTVGSVEQGAKLTDASREQIGEIGQKIATMVARMSEVASSIGEQRSATSALAQTTEDITVRVQETDHALQGARATIDQLATVARSTQAQFDRFRL